MRSTPALLVVLGFSAQEVRQLEIALPGAHVYEPVLAVDADGGWILEARVHDGTERSGVWRRPDKGGFGPPELGPPLGREPQESRIRLVDGALWEARSYLAGSYADGDYEIAVVGPGAGEPERVGLAGADLGPTLVAAGSRVALVWTNSYFQERRNGELVTVGYDRWSDKVYEVAWLGEDGRFGKPLELRLTDNATKGTTVADRAFPVAGERDGEVFVIYGKGVYSRVTGGSFQLMLCRVDPTGVSAPIPLDEGYLGPVESVGVARTPDRLIVARTVYEGPGGLAPEKAYVRVLAIPLASLPARKPWSPPAAEARRFAPAGLDLAHDGRTERPSTDLGGAARRAWFGNLHMHSDISRDASGYEGSPESNLRVARELAVLDFAMLSDHAEMLCFTEWSDLQRASERWNEPGLFVTLFGYEWTSARYGHKNLVAGDLAALGEPIGAFGDGPLARTPDELFSALIGRAVLAIPHHVSHGLGQPTDWSFQNDEVQRLVEIFQVRGNYEYDGAPYQKQEESFVPGHSVRDALAQGHRLGIVASPDHGGGMGLAGVWSGELTRAAIFEALHARRTFGTTGAKMTLALEVAGAFQGAEIELAPGAPVAIRAEVSGTADELELTLVVDGEELAPRRFDGRSARAEWQLEFPGTGVRYYYLRARQGDGHLGWSSPVWVTPRR